MKKLLKYFLCLLGVVGFYIPTGHAATVSTTDIKDSGSGVYKYYHKTKPADEWVFGKEVMKKIAVGDNAGFCIDFGPKLISGSGFTSQWLSKYLRSLIEDSSSMYKVYNKINLILNAYENSDKSDAYYLAAQKLIWQEINGLSKWTYPEGSSFNRIIFESSSLRFVKGNSNKDNVVSSVNAAIDSINSSIGAYDTFPSFLGDGEVTIDDTERTGSFTLTDTKGVLSKFTISTKVYKVSGSVATYTVSKEGNVLHINVDGNTSDGDYIVIDFSKGSTSNPTYLYTNGVSQRVIVYRGNTPSRNKRMVVYFGEKANAKVGLVVAKRDKNSDELLSGAEIELYNAAGTTLIDSCITDSSGSCNFTGLDEGTYCVKEKSAPDGYKLDSGNNACHNVELGWGANQKPIKILTFKDTKKLGGFKLYKFDNKSKKVLAGVEFKLLNSASEEIMNFVTDENGEFEVFNLEPGDYTVQEITALDGYDKVAPTKFNVKAESVSLVNVGNDKIDKVTTGDLPLIIVISFALLSLVTATILRNSSLAKKA